ncbi:50S ribosomal protein L6 [Ornatilinea apprima]|uniref:Large ribosomal subunit protein uL6 n=1 Tax=Ornatilinea apprima TaxID=1134406 RepID=A0A0P6Y3G8_9CHLR|nr:50S ribosomal protein L6 [Ornatilinea apprima]KPL76153.1 50S ribosomal protein L6 [Ornatilinea apprima]
MSRIGRMPVVIPAGVQVDIQGNAVSVKGPKGQLSYEHLPEVAVSVEDNILTVTRTNETPRARALHGTTRAVINNMVTGVSTGFEKSLEIQGVGYRAEMNGQNLVLYVGYSHPVVVEPKPGLSFDVDTKTRIVKVMGADKEVVGQAAAEVRKVRPPEPYHGKGIRYLGEQVRRKAGKTGKA